MFHDLREVARITSLFHSLRHLVTNIQFSKYMEHTVASAASLTLPLKLESLRIGTDDAIPVLLSTELKQLRLKSLILDGVKFWHLRYISSSIRDLGSRLLHFEINFSPNDVEWISDSDLAQLSLINQTNLQSIRITGIKLFDPVTSSCALGLGLPPLIAKLPQTSNLRKLSISVVPESESTLRLFDWPALRRSVDNHPQCTIYIEIHRTSESIKDDDETRAYIFSKFNNSLKDKKDRRVHIKIHDVIDATGSEFIIAFAPVFCLCLTHCRLFEARP
ncbi:hypothetical protein NP233_g11476 [Leucocoprinus birnbaumii]|uniref:Uncharacterized protein n=1 Tax=Leucocoprinus birnbaumii TaxID=56174 RepID=A0AAD5VHD5_9AGAR|nr:hypothetical protein NP233_g11476 [Leucocoprinus birnbaumii]